MKYALISDVHGNYPALCAVLADAESADVDKYIFIGDYYMGIPYPNQVIDRIKKHPNSYAVRGNQEDRIEKLLGKDQSAWNDGQFQALYWYFNELSDQNKEYLISLPRSAMIDHCLHISHWSSEFIGNVEMNQFCTHILGKHFGTRNPSKDEILAFISEKLDRDDTFQDKLHTLDDGIYIFGHSHIQWHKKYSNKVFINPGSCGFPIDFHGGAPYTILEITDEGVSVTERRVIYDEQACIKQLLSSPLYKYETIWSEMLLKEFTYHREALVQFLMFVEEYANRIGDKERPFSKKTWRNSYDAWVQSYQN